MADALIPTSADMNARRVARELREALDAARAELAEVKAELEAACDNAEEARQAQAHWHEQSRSAERRGAVAALREAADEIAARLDTFPARGSNTRARWAEWFVRDRAARLAEGDDL